MAGAVASAMAPMVRMLGELLRPPQARLPPAPLPPAPPPLPGPADFRKVRCSAGAPCVSCGKRVAKGGWWYYSGRLGRGWHLTCQPPPLQVRLR